MNEFNELLKQFESDDGFIAKGQPKPNILVVDDDKSVREGLKSAFAYRYAVVTAETGSRGVEMVDRTFHCVILDVKMQGIDGFETYPELKNKCPDVPIVFFTAFQSEHDLQEVINRFKPEGYVEKGQDISVLEHLIANAVEKYNLILQNEAYKKRLVNKIAELNTAYEKLQQQSEKLEELNLVLNVLIEKRDQKRYRLEQSIVKNIKENIQPDIDRLKKENPSRKQQNLIRMVESGLHEITSHFLLDMSIQNVGLTSCELKIANYIKQGKSSKEIAEHLSISIQTVKNHRINIRKKLGVSGKPVNLYSYLSSMESS